MKEKDNNVIMSFKKGMSVSQIAKKYHISRQGVYNILNRNNINYKKVPSIIDVDKIAQDLKHNNIKTVMNKNGVSYHALRKIINENELEKREIMKNVLNVKDVKRLYCDIKLDDEKIGKIFNCSPYTVRSFRWKHNIYDENRRWMDILTKDVYQKLRRNGKSLTEISQIVNIPYYLVVKAKSIYEK